MATTSDIGIGATNITTLGTISAGTWNATGIGFIGGGLGANLTGTFSNGGILYSNASNAVILAGTATADRILLSGSNTTPAWSTATYPATIVINRLLYSGSANAVSGLATNDSAIAITASGGVPSLIAMSNGEMAIGSTGASPVSAILSTGVVTGRSTSISTGSHFISIQIRAALNQNGSAVTLVSGSLNLTNNGATLVTYTLPTSPVAGATFIIIGNSAGGWKVAQNASQFIELPGGVVTTTGTGGSLSSDSQYDCVTIVFSQLTNTFQTTSILGNITYV